MRGYGTTLEEAFRRGVQLAEQADRTRRCLDAGASIRILPEKEKGLYVVEVSLASGKGSCGLPPGLKTADTVPVR